MTYKYQWSELGLLVKFMITNTNLFQICNQHISLHLGTFSLVRDNYSYKIV